MIRRVDSSASVHLVSESSYESRSVETAVKATSTTNILDEVLIPLIAESNRSTKSKGIIFAISIIIVFIQIILGSLFCLIENNKIPKGLRKVAEVFFLGYSYDSFETNQRFIMLAFQLFSLVALLIIIINFKYVSHEFSKFTLGFARLWYGDLYSIFIIPTFVYTVASAIYYGEHPQIQNAFFTFVHVILLFMCFFISRYLTENLERNIYISSSPIFLWRTIPFFNALLIYGVAFSSCPLALIFTNWIEYVPQLLLIIISPFVSINLLSKCFQKPALNAFAISLPVFSFLGGAMSLINNIVDDFPKFVYFIFPCAGFIISHIIYMLYLILYKDKKIKEFLTKNFELTDDEKLQLFDSMKISKQDKCYSLLVGLVNKCPLFLNWSLSHYLINRDPEDMNFLTFATWLVSFFPSETRIMNSYLSQINKYPYLSFSERCSFFQLHRIYVLRESSFSTSLEAAADFRPVHEQSEKVISYISNFWRFAASDPEEIQDSIFHLISKERRQAETMWTDLLEKYPNNAQMMHDYARFLANGESKFQKAIQNHQKAILTESGTVAKNDKAFKCFLLRFPEYLKRGYVDNKGRLMMQKILMMLNKNESSENNDTSKGNKLNDISYISMNSSETNISASTASSNFDSSANSSDVDFFGEKQIDMEEAKSFIKMTELRIAMEKSLEQYRSPVSSKILVASILRLILSLVLCFIIFFIVYFDYPSNEILFSHLTKFNKAFHLFELVTNLYPWSWMSQYTGNIDNEFNYANGIRFHHSYVNMTNDITFQIANLSKFILEYIDQFSYDLYSADTVDSSTDFVTYYSQYMLDNIACIEYSKNDVRIEVDEESTTMDSLLKTVITVFLKLSSSKSNKKQKWNGKDNYCDMYIQSHLLQKYTTELIQTISTPVDDAFFSSDWREGEPPGDEGEGGAKLLNLKKDNATHRINMSKKKKNYRTLSQILKDKNNNNVHGFDKDMDDLNSNDYNDDFQRKRTIRHKRQRISTRLLSFLSNLLTSTKNLISSTFSKLKPNPPNTKSTDYSYKKSRKAKRRMRISEKLMIIRDDPQDPQAPQIEGNQTNGEEDDNDSSDMEITLSSSSNDNGLSTLDFFMGFIPFFVTLFSFPSLIFLSSSLNKEKEDLVTLLIGTSEEEATAASHVVTGKASSSTIQMSSASKKSYVWLWSGLSLIIVIACLMIIIGMAKTKESKQKTYIQHFSFMILERNFVFDIGRDLFYLLIYNEMNKKTLGFDTMIFLDDETSNQYLLDDFDFYDTIARIIREGDGGVRQVHGFDSNIDKLKYDDKCFISNYFNPNDFYFHDCISLDRLITYFVGESKLIHSAIESYSFTDPSYISLNMLIITRFAEDYEQLADKYEQRFKDQSNLFNLLCIVLFILAILCTVGAFLIEIFLLIRFHNEIAIFRTLVLRLNPLYFVSNPDLLSTVYKSGKIDKAVTSSSHAMFQTAHDALFILKEDLIIESVNPSATNIFGFTPEQMLGQSIKFILPNDLNSSTYYVVDLMMSGATSLNYESDATGTKDDGSDVPLRLSVIGLTQDKNNSSTEYVESDKIETIIDQKADEKVKTEENKESENKESQQTNETENKEGSNNEKENDSNQDSTNKEAARSLTGGKKATAFAFIMKDMTEEQRQKLAVEEAKKKAEVILLQILPKDIIMRLNRGDKEITFTVASSTIVFIDIEKFSQYSATLSAKDIMLNLSRIFTAFDKICSTFNLITKIKMIGDDYMAAAGLFTPDINPKEHALQVLQFAMQCLEALEEQNVILNASLQVRIGINTDGPIIAGVLGTEKPLFDIIGDPINVASRLQSTCIPNLIQISEGTYQYVGDLDLKFEEREIYLKGKGVRKTFLIYPETQQQNKAFTENDQDSSISSSILQQIVNQDSNSINLSKSKNLKKNPK